LGLCCQKFCFDDDWLVVVQLADQKGSIVKAKNTRPGDLIRLLADFVITLYLFLFIASGLTPQSMVKLKSEGFKQFMNRMNLEIDFLFRRKNRICISVNCYPGGGEIDSIRRAFGQPGEPQMGEIPSANQPSQPNKVCALFAKCGWRFFFDESAFAGSIQPVF
jgi:hypothetical protein